MSTLLRHHESLSNFTKTSALTSVITTEQARLVALLCAKYNIDVQVNAAAESNGQFFNKTIQIDSPIRFGRIDSNRESECSTTNRAIQAI